MRHAIENWVEIGRTLAAFPIRDILYTKTHNLRSLPATGALSFSTLKRSDF
jgi:hypothetical protein